MWAGIGGVVPWITLGWLFWSYVPERLAVLAAAQHEVPLAARITITAGAWFLRMLPFAIVGVGISVTVWPISVLLAGGALGVWARADSSPTLRAWLLGVALTLLATGVVACVYVVVSLEVAILLLQRPTGG